MKAIKLTGNSHNLLEGGRDEQNKPGSLRDLLICQNVGRWPNVGEDSPGVWRMPGRDPTEGFLFLLKSCGCKLTTTPKLKSWKNDEIS